MPIKHWFTIKAIVKMTLLGGCELKIYRRHGNGAQGQGVVAR